MNKIIKFSIITLTIGLVVYFKKSGLADFLTLEYLKTNKEILISYYQSNPLQTLSIYFLIYILTTALSLPGATILTLAGGALFGFTTGLVTISFASTLGATLAFLSSRFIFRDIVEKKWGHKLKTLNEGIQKDGAFYLFTLRLVPIFPFFLINLSMGLTKINILTFYFVSQIGMLAGTMVYVNAGVQLSSINSLADIASPSILLSFALLGVFPLIAKKIIEHFKSLKVYKNFKKPQSFDYNMVAIGGGAAGLVTSYIGAAVKAKVALIEKHKMGGDCLNTGCVPSKALIKSAKMANFAKDAKKYGFDQVEIQFNFAKIMERVQDVIKEIEPHDSIERYEKLGVDCITGSAKIISPWEIEVNGKIITTKNITIATGAGPFVPPIKGIQNVKFLTSENLWDLKELPEELIILGAGPIGLEMAQSFNRFGSKVTVIEMGKQIMSKEDADVANLVYRKLLDEGVNILLEHKAVEFEGSNTLICHTTSGETVKVNFEKILVAIGRKANTSGFGLEDIGVELNPNGTISTNEYLQSNFPNIFACGDVAGPYQLTHMAAHQAWYCAVNGLFGSFKKFKVDYSAVPWTTYTDPEVATVGKNEKELAHAGIDYDLTTYGIDDLDRAITESEQYGLVKVLTQKGSDKILGATIVGMNAGELLIEFVSAMKNGFGLNAILGTIHSYPTMGEANKYAAGNWKKARTPEKLLKIISKYHQWRRG